MRTLTRVCVHKAFMKRQNNNIFERVLSARAMRLGSPREQILGSSIGSPSFLRAVGNDPSVLDTDLAELRRSPYPQSECLMPYEIEELQGAGLQGLGEERVSHARNCVFCSSLLASVEPDPGRIGEFLGYAKAASRGGGVPQETRGVKAALVKQRRKIA